LHVLSEAKKKGAHLGILSMNWSKDLIRSVINESLDDITIFCNDLEYDDKNISTGFFSEYEVYSGIDKRNYFSSNEGQIKLWKTRYYFDVHWRFKHRCSNLLGS